jgi:predicted CXXCH cytochrome family protein
MTPSRDRSRSRDSSRRLADSRAALGLLLAIAAHPLLAAPSPRVSSVPALATAGIAGTKHDLSVQGPGPIRAATETEICLFCHAPHRTDSETPLWNHAQTKAAFTPYTSSTTRATVRQPTGSSKLCLSCHDGTVALGMVNSRSRPIAMQNNITTMPAGSGNLGTDLSGTHPVSFTYDSALVAANGQLKDPNTLIDKVRLDHDKQVQCTSCHDPHSNRYGKFLVQDNKGSALCVACHSLNLWQNSAHSASPKSWTGNGLNPWPRAAFTTVAANGCENCHVPHAAGAKARLLTFPTVEQTCFSCHSGNVATKNIQSEFNKASIHPIFNAAAVHDPMEDPVNSSRHVACVDCHNPHAAYASSAVAPNAPGALAGRKGVNLSGAVVNSISREYELCFRCHADSTARGPAHVTRQAVQTNTRLAFSPANQSYHPVGSLGRNPIVPSLLSPYTASTQIYCTDCHNNDQGPNSKGSGPNGPHGSIYTPLLERQLILADFQGENVLNYALCYKCHNRDSILNDQSFRAANSLGQDRGHRFHIVEQQTACTTCHDSHGVAKNKHLINFNVGYVTPSSNGRLEYLANGPSSGTCSLKCHGKDHVATSYPVLSASALRGTPLVPTPAGQPAVKSLRRLP